MGITPPASALAHVALIQNPVQSDQSTGAPPPLIPITQQPFHIPVSAIQLSSQLNPQSATALNTPTARVHSQLGPGSALPVEASAASLLMGASTCPLPDPIRKKILNLEYIDMADLRPDAWFRQIQRETILCKSSSAAASSLSLTWPPGYNAMHL